MKDASDIVDTAFTILYFYLIVFALSFFGLIISGLYWLND